MKKIKQILNKPIVTNILIVLLFSSIFFIITIKRNGIAYIMNDDIAMKSMASGIYSGEQTLNMVFSVFPFSGLLYVLYSISNLIDWYGLVLIISNIFFFIYTVYSIIKDKKSIYEKIIYTSSLFFITAFLFYGFLVELTFTTTASFITTCCLILYLLPNSKFKNLIITLGIALAFGIRSKACLMCLVFFLPAFFYKNRNNIQNFKKDLFFGIKIGFILLSCVIIQIITVSDTSWKQYLEYNNYRSLYYDYYFIQIKELPDEEKYALFYDSGFNDEEIDMLLSYSGGIGFYEDIPEKMTKLIELCEERGLEINSDFKGKLLYLFNINLNKYYLITLFVMIYFIIRYGNRKKEIPLVSLLVVVQILLLIYLAKQGRVPDRVVVPLYFNYIVMNLFIIFDNVEIKNIVKKIINYDKVLITIIAFILFTISTQHLNIYSVDKNTIEDGNAILKYFEKNKENFYIYDRNNSEMYNIINKYPADNYINKNGWSVFSPLHYDKIKKQGVNSLRELLLKDNVYMVLDSDDTSIYESIYDNLNIEKVDEYDGFYIYKFTNED